MKPCRESGAIFIITSCGSDSRTLSSRMTFCRAMTFSSVLHRSELLAATSEIREQLCLLYTDLLSLVVDVAIRFYKTVNSKFVSLSIKSLLISPQVCLRDLDSALKARVRADMRRRGVLPALSLLGSLAVR